MSVRGTHRVAGRTVALALAEERGWARAVFSPRWEDAAFYAGHGTAGSGIWVAHFSLFLGPDRTSEAVPPGGTARAATLDWAATPDARPVTGYQPAAPVRGTVPSRLECRPAPRPRAAGGVHRRPAQV